MKRAVDRELVGREGAGEDVGDVEDADSPEEREEAGKQKAIAEQVQLRVVEYPTHVILGQFTQPTGLRANIDGLLHTPALALWNVEKK